jgi:ankyrin repeat protein
MIEKIAGGRTDLVVDWIASGGAATAADAHDVTLIEWCAIHGDVGAIRHLLSHGASLAALGANLGLVNAVFYAHWQLGEFLVESGVDVNVADPETGETALHFALSKPASPARDRIVQILLACGADPHRTTKPGVETGAFMRDCRTKGETPLHRAAAFGSEASIRALLEAGASREAKDVNGDTPLGWASWYLRPRPILRQLSYAHHTVRGDGM